MANKSLFKCFAENTARYTGSATVFIIACSIVAIWGLTGPLFNFSDTWQLVINTGTTIVTFLMVFLIQNTQNREAYAVQLKLDELIRVTKGAHVGLLDLEHMEDEELKAIQDKFLALAKEAHAKLEQGGDDCDTPDIALK
jgi:low affinity Fe/Cu permease